MTDKLLLAARLIVSTLRLDATSETVRRQVAEAREVVDWPVLVHHADGHTLTPLLCEVWREADALASLPADVRDRMERAWRDNARRNESCRAQLLDLHTLFERIGVESIVLKGWPLVERLYASPAQRFQSDYDFLVRQEDAQRGYAALLAAGYRPLPQSGEGWVEKHLPSVWLNDGYQWDGYLYDPFYPRPVELHTRLWEDRWRGLDVRELTALDLWGDAQTRKVAGVPMRVLSDENALIHLAMHFAGHLVEREARLNQLLDLARFMEQTSVDWQTALTRANAARITRFVYASLYLAREIFGSPLPPSEVWERLRGACPPGLRSWVESEGVRDVLTSDYRRRRPGIDYRLTFLSVCTFAERLGVLRFALVPPLGQLALKYRLKNRRLAYLMYLPYIVERAWMYSTAFIREKRTPIPY